MSHCPHSRGEALGTVVLMVNQSHDYLDSLHKTVEAKRDRRTKLSDRVEQLRKEFNHVKRELKLKPQKKFATSEGQNDTDNQTK